jgi:hypothetical protein
MLGWPGHDSHRVGSDQKMGIISGPLGCWTFDHQYPTLIMVGNRFETRGHGVYKPVHARLMLNLLPTSAINPQAHNYNIFIYIYIYIHIFIYICNTYIYIHTQKYPKNMHFSHDLGDVEADRKLTTGRLNT